MAPTRAPRTTRGSRTCQTMVTATVDTDGPGCQGSRVSSASPTARSGRSAGPTETPTATATTRAVVATASARPDRTRGIAACAAGPAAGSVCAGVVLAARAVPGGPLAGSGWPVAGPGWPVAD